MGVPIEFRRDGSWELPEGWVWARLGGLGRWGSGGTPKADNASYYGGKIPWYRIADLNDGFLSAPERSISQLGLENSSAKLIPPGTLLCAMYGSIGKLGITTLECATNQAIAFCVPREGIDVRYLMFALLRQRKHLSDLGQGGTQQNISQTILLDEFVPIAPAAEQRRIVARIDELFTEIADGEAALAQARNDLDTWRRALLKAAVTGELTREWRKHKEPNQTGSQMLESLRSSRPKKVSARRSQEIEPIELPEIPSSWCWGTVDDLTASMEYGTSEKCDTNSKGLPVLRMGNIQDGEITFDKLKFLGLERADDAPRLEVGDILFNRTNSEELVGKSAVVETLAQEMSFASYLIRLKTLTEVSSMFVVAWINSAFGRKWIRANKSQQVGQANLSGGKLKSMPIPVLSAMEQAEIARRLREATELLKDQQADIATAHAATFGVRQSILKDAFEGRLVEQDPRDEPADRLLARVSEQNEVTPSVRRSRGRRAVVAAE